MKGCIISQIDSTRKHRQSTEGNERHYTLEEPDYYLVKRIKTDKSKERERRLLRESLNGRREVEDGELLTSDDTDEIDSEDSDEFVNIIHGQDSYYCHGHEFVRPNWSLASNLSSASNISSANLNGSFLELQTSGSETSPDGEMRCVVDFNPISFSNEPIITRESLQNLENEDKHDLTFEEEALEEFLQEKIQMETRAGRATKFVKASTSVLLCKSQNNIVSGKGCNCNALHVCKFYLLSTCLKNHTCKFGHNLTTEHNILVFKRRFLHRVLIGSIKRAVRFTYSRNGTTVPSVCKFYNAKKGCIRGDRLDCGGICQYLHICQHYIFGKCKFRNHGCKRSHSLNTGQPRRVLDLYGLGQVDHQTLTNLIRKTANETDEIFVAIEDGCQTQANTVDKKVGLLDANLKFQISNFVESESFILLETEIKTRHISNLANDHSTKQEVSSDQIQVPIYHNADLISTSAREINEKKDGYMEAKEMLQEINVEGTEGDIKLVNEIKINAVSESINTSVDVDDNEESKIVADNRTKFDHATIQTPDRPGDTDHTEKVDLMVDTKCRHNDEVEVTMAKTDTSMTGDEQQSHKAEETETKFGAA